MEVVLNVLAALFAVIGLILVAEAIIKAIVGGSNKGLRGTYIYIPSGEETGEEAAKLLGSAVSKAAGFRGRIIIVCCSEKERSAAIEELCAAYGKIYKYEAGQIEIMSNPGCADCGKCCFCENADDKKAEENDISENNSEE